MKTQMMEPLTKSIMFSGICILAALFNLYSMKKNDRIVINKFLYIKGFALSTALLCLALTDLTNIAMHIGILPLDYKFTVEVGNFYKPYMIFMTVAATLSHAGYLFSLKNRCWRFENILYSLKKKFNNFMYSEHPHYGRRHESNKPKVNV